MIRIQIEGDWTTTREGGLGRTTAFIVDGGRGGLLGVGATGGIVEVAETVEAEYTEETDAWGDKGIDDTEVEEGIVEGTEDDDLEEGTEGDDFEEGIEFEPFGVVEFRGEGELELVFERGVVAGEGPLELEGENLRGETREFSTGSAGLDWNWEILERIPELTPVAPRGLLPVLEVIGFAGGLYGLANAFIGMAGGLGTAYIKIKNII